MRTTSADAIAAVKRRTRAARVRTPNTRITIEEFAVEHKPLVAKLSKVLRKSFKHTGGGAVALGGADRYRSISPAIPGVIAEPDSCTEPRTL
jgi:hypothetical protein